MEKDGHQSVFRIDLPAGVSRYLNPACFIVSSFQKDHSQINGDNFRPGRSGGAPESKNIVVLHTEIATPGHGAIVVGRPPYAFRG